MKSDNKFSRKKVTTIINPHIHTHMDRYIRTHKQTNEFDERKYLKNLTLVSVFLELCKGDPL